MLDLTLGEKGHLTHVGRKIMYVRHESKESWEEGCISNINQQCCVVHKECSICYFSLLALSIGPEFKLISLTMHI